MQVITSQHKSMQVLAKWSRKLTQVFNWGLLASQFDQGFKGILYKSVSLHRYRFEGRNTGSSSYQSVLQVQHIEGHSAQQTGIQYEKIWHGTAICLHCPLRQYQVSLQFLG